MPLIYIDFVKNEFSVLFVYYKNLFVRHWKPFIETRMWNWVCIFFLLMSIKLDVNDCIAYLHVEEEILEFKKGQSKFESPKLYLCLLVISHSESSLANNWRIFHLVAFKLHSNSNTLLLLMSNIIILCLSNGPLGLCSHESPISIMLVYVTDIIRFDCGKNNAAWTGPHKCPPPHLLHMFITTL
jgi:hypothetical protein